MTTETPRTNAIEPYCVRYDLETKEIKGEYVPSDFARTLERELNAALSDKQRLDALESVPFALEINYNPNQPKADSLASLRSQIDYFLAQRAAEMPNEKS
jgi:hypothetical protein